MSVDCLTITEANAIKVGKGRSNPNQDPFLPPPKDRFAFDFSIPKLLAKYIGSHWLKYAALGCFGFFVLLMILFAIPLFLSILTSTAISRTIVG